MIGETRPLAFSKHCASVYRDTPCALTEHIGTHHWNGKMGDDRMMWTDAEVVRDLQELIENLRETNKLYLT